MDGQMIIINQVFVLFLLIVSGFVIKKLKVVSDNINKEISSLVINVALPAIIITSMNQSFTPEILKNSIMLLLISACVYGFAIVFAKLYVKLNGYSGSKRDIYEYILIFANVGYMGYPVVSVALGEIGVFYAAVYNLSFNFLVWTYGVHLIARSSDEEKIKKNFFNPGLIALIIGFSLFLLSINFPSPIHRTLEMIGST
ncbi:MAG: AEC family transporter, partial [Acidaminobacteraceae bacterium]